MKEIEEKYKWNISKIFSKEEEFDKAIDRIKELLDMILSLKGNILKSSDNLLKYYEYTEEQSVLLEKVYLYAHLGYDKDMDNKSWQEKKEMVSKLNDDIGADLSFVFPEILSKDFSYVERLLEEKEELKKYHFDMETSFRHKEHILSENEEKLLSEASVVFRTPRDTFSALNNLDIKFDKIKDENGKLIELTSSNYIKYVSSRDRKVRKRAFNSCYKYYREHINTISALYISNIKGDVFGSKTRKYNSVLESSLFNDRIDPKLYINLIDSVNMNVNYLQEYYKLKAKVLGVNKLHMYDTYVNISEVPDADISFEEGKQMIIEALNPLGKKYINDLLKLLNNRCADVYPKKNKRSGAYQWGPYGVEPFVLLNYENNIDSVSTTAHEFGHAMHSYYSDSNNIHCYAGYPIFLAEIASTVNEILFSEYMSNKSKNIDEKIYYIVEYLDKFKATVFRQTMFAEFEHLIHKKYENGENLTKDLLCDTYMSLNKKHFSPALEVDEDIKYEWARIPHFYTPFYVYKYATSFMISTIIANKLISKEKGFEEKYIRFLSSGGSNYPLEILKELDIDLSNNKVFDNAFDVFKEKNEELKKLLKEKGV